MMQKRRMLTIGLCTLIAVSLCFFSAGQPQAQTTANGPYYATPSWDQTLPAATRFIVLSNFAGAAVLDRNTGLVWERSPSTTEALWSHARQSCANKSVGGQYGWRLPSVHELTSLLNFDVPPPGPTLPAGHPFINIQSFLYWSATTDAEDSTQAWYVGFNNVGLLGGVFTTNKTGSFHVWCVRGGGLLSEH